MYRAEQAAVTFVGAGSSCNMNMCGAEEAATTCVWASAVATLGRPTQRIPV
jgi:hypothetical protein